MVDSDIYKRDMGWLQEADFVVAEVTNPSLGVGYEISMVENKKPVLCIYKERENKRLSAMLNGNGGLKIEKYTRVEDLKEVFNKFFKEDYFFYLLIYIVLVLYLFA